jgi:uncharacterized protein
MLRWLSMLSILLGVLLMGCSTPTPAKPPSVTPSTQTQKPVNLGQKLPISAQAVIPNGTTIGLEVARTPEQQAMGLMYRPALPDDRGMLFSFPYPFQASFWMKNVPVALDMVFMRDGVVQYVQASAPPCTKEPCPTYGPQVPVNQVIELRSGRAAELVLKVGDRVKIEYLHSAPSRR